MQDRLNHASLIDAARLSGCKLRRYPHNDAEGALRQLRTVPEACRDRRHRRRVQHGRRRRAAARTVAGRASVQHALLYVDDAHGIGVVGAEGRGCVADAGLVPGDICCSWPRWARRSAATAPAVLGSERHHRPPRRNRAPVHLHHRVAAGPGRRDPGRGQAGASRPLAPREAAEPDRAAFPPAPRSSAACSCCRRPRRSSR